MGAKRPKSLVSIYFAFLSGRLGVCLSLSNKRQNGRTDRAHMTSHDTRESLWRIKISRVSFQQNSIVIKFFKSTIFFL